MDELDSRITDLEIRYSHQSELVEQLSDIIRAQQGQIDALKRQLESLKTQLDAGEEDMPHEKPPHY